MPRNLQRRLGMGLLLGFAIFVGFGMWGDFRSLKESLLHFHWPYFPLIFLFTLIGYGFRFAKWEIFLHALAIGIPLPKSLSIFFSGLSMAVTPGKAGEVLKSFLLREKAGIPVSRTMPVVFAERVTDLVSMILLALWGIGRFSQGKMIILFTIVFIGLVVLVIQSRTLCLRILRGFGRFSFLKSGMAQLETLYESAYSLFRFRVFAFATGISLLSWFSECLSFYYVFHGFGVQESIQDSAFIFSFSSIAGAISMLPGGLGVAETSMVGIMMGMGIPKTGAVAVTMMGRFGTLWFGVIVGLVVLLTCHRSFLQAKEEKDNFEPDMGTIK
jgi:glycosyltransferase 2 family protein